MTSVAISRRAYPDEAFQAARDSGFTELQARIIAARLPALQGDAARAVSPSLAQLDPPHLLPDIAAATRRLADAIQRRERILVICDHDVDGSTSLAIIRSALCDVFMVAPERLRCYTSHRLREGYGVSDALVERILADVDEPSLAITADQGSADEQRIAHLREHGIDTIVTDHHEIPTSGIPASAVAVVNPTREDSAFPDRSIAGCYVAFLVMCALREELLQRRILPPRTPRLSHLLDYAACGTVADCVDLARSHNNRAVVRHGLHLMNTQPRPCWRAMKRLLGPAEFTAETLGWQVGSRLNASGRLDDSMRSVDFLLARTEDEANRLVLDLDAFNTDRRAIQDRMTDVGRREAARQTAEGAAAIVVHLPEGHAGVHGVCASRLVQSFGRPAVCFSPKLGHDGVLTGSLRSIDGVHVLQALLRADELAGGSLTLSCGGHAMAAGAVIRVEDLGRFQDALRQAVAEQCDPSGMGPRIDTDGPVPRVPDLRMLEEIAALEPFGRQFPAPVFEGEFDVRDARPVGDGRHLRLELADAAGRQLAAVWFGARADSSECLPVAAGDRATFAYALAANTYRGTTKVDLRVQTARIHKE